MRQILPHGFESFAITFSQDTAGVEWQSLADQVRRLLDGTGVTIASLGLFGNPLRTDDEGAAARTSIKACIDHAHLFGCDIVSAFTGRTPDKPIHECIARFNEVWMPLAERAGKQDVRIAFENCDMGGTWQRGDWNIAHNPTAWELMFDAVPLDNIGLEWEPAHQMVSLIDPMPQLREWVPRIFHVHGKDATIHWDVVRKYGVHSSMHDDIALPGKTQPVPPFAYHRTPGFGDSNWTDIISELRKGGFKGAIDIEGWHDPVYNNELEMTGQVHALNYLKRCRGGRYVPNPE
jgi:sugar phosphate isomerase/epimerase